MRIGDVGGADEGVERAGNQRHPRKLTLAVLEHPHGDAQEGEQGQSLVGPCEVTPQNVEAVLVELGEHDDAGSQDKHRDGQTHTLAVGGLVQVERLRQGQAQSTQSGIAGGDGQNDDADQGDDAAHGAQDILAHHADGTGGQGGVGLLQSQIVHAHSASGPHHSDEALQDHHVVEGHAALTLVLHRAGDDGRLGGVEAGQNAAGHGNEEDRQEIVALEVVGIGKALDRAVSTGELQDGRGPVVPHVQQRIALDEDADEHADGGEQQDGAEDGVNAADDGVDGEHGGDQVIQEDHAVNDPGGDGGGLAVEAEHGGGGNVARGINEHSAHQQQKQTAEHVVYVENALIGIALDHLGHLGAAVTQADHAGEIVVHGAADDVADGDGDKCDGPEQNALDGPQDGAGTGDVQQVDQAVSPALHGDIVHAVLFGVGRGLTVVRPENFLAEASVQRSAAEQDHKTDDKCCHKHTLLHSRFAIFRAPGQLWFMQ